MKMFSQVDFEIEAFETFNLTNQSVPFDNWQSQYMIF